ncbi:MAG: AMP-binding protein [Deltaproteobacteria bacterium]|nr:AMP-binding protein [Deltaproteobacteria bacterium]
MPEKTRESFEGQYFKSGDLGYLDAADGNRLYLVGRSKELIISGGYNVYPKEIENVLGSHAVVGELAVVGLPDEDFGERVTAVAVLKERCVGDCSRAHRLLQKPAGGLTNAPSRFFDGGPAP